MHVSIGVHHNSKRAAEARKEDWMAVTKEVAAEGLVEVR